MTRTSSKFVMAAILAALGAGATQAGSNYGCFKVSADQLNIRDRPYSTAAVIGTAKKGDVLEKRKLWCTLRGYWCAIRNKDGLEGYADTNFMDKSDCP